MTLPRRVRLLESIGSCGIAAAGSKRIRRTPDRRNQGTTCFRKIAAAEPNRPQASRYFHDRRYKQKSFSQIVPFRLSKFDTVLPWRARKVWNLKPPKETRSPVIKLPAQPIGKELRDSFERVRDEPIPDKLKDLISELKKKDATGKRN